MVNDKIVDRALELVAEGGGNYEYFFSRLKTPDWIAPLIERGRFSHPPDAVSEADSIHFPDWPEGNYLIRMAPEAPEQVFNALTTKVYESNNYIVHQILLEIAIKLPVEYSREIARLESRWVSKQPALYGLYPDRSAALIFHLATNGESNAAIDLLRGILDVRRPADDSERETPMSGEHLRWGVDPVGKVDTWEIDRIMGIAAGSLAEAAPGRLLSTLSDLLDKAIAIHDNDRGNTEDFSTTWRPHIEHSSHLDRLDVMTGTLQKATLLVAEGTTEGYEIALRVFRKHKWPIFRRFEAYALTASKSVLSEIMDQTLSDPSRYENATGNPEFNELLGKSFGKLGEKTKERIMAIIDAGPDFSRYSRYLAQEEIEGRRVEAETWLSEDWRLRWLTPIANDLDDTHRLVLAELTTKYGPPRPDFTAGGARVIGHHADTTDEELRKLTPEELIRFLKTWTPPPSNHPGSPSRAGLAMVLSRWLATDPQFFTANLELFHDSELHPTYLRTILDGFTAALKSEQQFDTFAIAGTIEWILRNTKAEPREGFKWEEDPGWSWAYMSSARFLTELFLHPDRLDVTRRTEFLPALELISQVESPTPEDEKEYRTKCEFGMLALNSTRPVGLEALMRYARWMKNQGVAVSAEALPRVFDLLSKHLDPAVDNSVAVREMFGMQFSLLAWLDRRWLESQLHALFPQKPFKVLDKFAWNSFLRFSNPISQMFPVMRFRYERAINSLDAKATGVDDSERVLGNHLMRFVAAGTIAIDDPLLQLFFSKASVVLRAQAVGDVGWHLGRQEEELDVAVRDRLMAFWGSRLSACLSEGVSGKREMAAFGWWIHSKKFPDSWAVEQAVTVIDNFRDLRPDFAVIERFAELSKEYPTEAVHCLAVILEEHRKGWAIHALGNHVTTILENALGANSTSHDEAVRLVNVLVARGNHAYRRLLTG